MAWARWAVAVLAAAAGALVVLTASLDHLERTVWTLGLRNVLPQLSPPLGDTARFGLAALAALLAALLGWGLLALLGVGGRRAAVGDEARATAPATPAWRLPPGDAQVDAPVDAPRSPAAEAPAWASAPPPVAAPAPAMAAEAAPLRAVEPPIAQGSVAGPVAPPAPAPAPDEPAVAAPPAMVDAAPAPDEPSVAAPAPAPVAPVAAAPAPAPAPAPAMDDAARAAMLASLARIEAQLAEARQGPVVGPNAQLIARFEELDSRVSAQVAQIAQQLVEVAQLARAAARAPAPAPAPAALIDAPRPLPSRPPRRLAARADLAAAIRDLRASLDAGPGLGGAA
jgi:hypothetical protein